MDFKQSQQCPTKSFKGKKGDVCNIMVSKILFSALMGPYSKDWLFVVPLLNVLSLYSENFLSGFKRTLDVSVLFRCQGEGGLCAVCSLNLRNLLVFC